MSNIDPFIRYFREAEKKSDRRLFGLELEVMGYGKENFERIPYETLNSILNSFKNQSSWKELEESGNLTELQRDGEKISLEPGGQLEYSTPPLKSVNEVVDHLEKFRNELKRLAAKENIFFLSVGYEPFQKLEEIPWMPKERYRVMREALKSLGGKTHHMMKATSGVQISVDFGDEADMRKKLVVSQTLSPILTLAFANSIMKEGKLSKLQSVRQETWNHFDPARTGLVPGSFEKDFGYEDYVRLLMDIPMLVIKRDGELIDASGLSLRRFMADGLGNHRFQFEDWVDHLRSVFFFSRLKNIIEFRTVDSTHLELIRVLAILVCGILYNQDALAKAYDYSLELGFDRVSDFCAQVCSKGFETESNGIKLTEAATEFLEIFEDCKCYESADYAPKDPLSPLMEILETKKNYSQLLREKITSTEPGKILEIFEDLDLVFA